MSLNNIKEYLGDIRSARELRETREALQQEITKLRAEIGELHAEKEELQKVVSRKETLADLKRENESLAMQLYGEVAKRGWRRVDELLNENERLSQERNTASKERDTAFAYAGLYMIRSSLGLKPRWDISFPEFSVGDDERPRQLVDQVEELLRSDGLGEFQRRAMGEALNHLKKEFGVGSVDRDISIVGLRIGLHALTRFTGGKCLKCGGSGWIIDRKSCPNCGGTGMITPMLRPPGSIG